MRKFVFMLAGNLGYGVAQWLVIIFIARLGTVEQQGEFSLVLGIAAPLSMFIRMNLRTVLATDHNNEFTVDEYFSNRLFFSIAIFALFPLLLLTSTDYENMAMLLLLVYSYKTFEGLSDLANGFYQKVGRLNLLSIGMLARSALMLIAFFIGLSIFNSIAVGALGTALLWGVFFIYFDRINVGKENIKLDKLVVKKAILVAKKCWPLGVTMSLISAISYMPIYFLGYFDSLESVGYFAVLNYVFIMGSYIGTTLVQTLSGRMAALYANELKKYLMILMILSLAAFILGSLGWWGAVNWGDSFMQKLYGPQYSGLSSALGVMVMCVSVSIPLALLGMSLTIMRSFYKMMLMNVIVFLFCGCISYIYISSGSVYEAALVVLYTLLFKLLISLLINASVLLDSRHKKVDVLV